MKLDIGKIRKSAERGNAKAQFQLGYAYFLGIDVKKNYHEAVKWFHKSEDQCNSNARYALIIAYADNGGVDRSLEVIVKCDYESGDRGDANSEYLHALYMMQRYTNAKEVFNRLIQQGIYSEQYQICEGMVQSFADDAVTWFRKAALKGHREAQSLLGSCYMNGFRVKPSTRMALRWFRKAAKQGDADAQYGLGSAYSLGRGVKQSITEAVKWYQKSAKKNNPDAQFSLGVCYANGDGVEKDIRKAYNWFAAAKNNGSAKAASALEPLLKCMMDEKRRRIIK